jgi:hypothetical protein
MFVETKNMFKIVVEIIIQSIFCLEMHWDNIFLIF